MGFGNSQRPDQPCHAGVSLPAVQYLSQTGTLTDCNVRALGDTQVWPWDLEAVRAQTSPVMLESAFLLFTLNEYLSRTAIMVQPLDLPQGSDLPSLDVVQVPLPLISKGSDLQGMGSTTVHSSNLLKATFLVSFSGRHSEHHLGTTACALSLVTDSSSTADSTAQT